MIKISERIKTIETSKTVLFTPLLAKMRRDGRQVIDFAVGEPEFETPDAVISATQKALRENHTRYGPVAGLPELRAAISRAFEGHGAENIIISNGSKQSLFAVFQVILNPEDQVIVQSPFWVSFAEQIKLAGGVPVFVDTIRHQLDVDAIKNAITPRTRAILINSPNNPTGAVYPEVDLKAVLELAHTHGLYLISDEAYEHFVYDDKKTTGLFDIKKKLDHLIVTKSFSKKYSMTGFRIGYIAADKSLVAAMTRFQSHACGNVCTFAQHGALAALEMPDDIFKEQKAILETKRDKAYQYAAGMFDCIRPAGAFYLFPNVSKFLNPDETSLSFAADLLSKTGVAVVPGEAFGVGGHIRISYAVPEEQIEEGFEKIATYLRDKFLIK